MVLSQPFPGRRTELDSRSRRVQLSKWRLWQVRREIRSIRLESEALRGRETQPN